MSREISQGGSHAYNIHAPINIRFGIVGTAGALLLAFGSPTYAGTVQFKADLNGPSEVPPNQTTGTGTVTATLDTTTKQLSWQGSYSGLTGPATAAHFHGPAEPGKNAGVAVPITPVTNPLQGSVTLTDAQAADLEAGRWYVNIHTAANPGGEVRGHLVKSHCQRGTLGRTRPGAQSPDAGMKRRPAGARRRTR